jgi:hypothetical protein
MDLDPQARDLVIRTVLGEAANEPDEGQAAVAAVIRNRALSGRFGNSIPEVILKRHQFEPWSTQAGRSRMYSYAPESDDYKRASAAVDSAFGGNDPTSGATHFFSPTAQAALGRNAPTWARGEGQAIGRHMFFAPEGRVTQNNSGLPPGFEIVPDQPAPPSGGLPHGFELVQDDMARARGELAAGLAEGKSGDKDIYRTAAFQSNANQPPANSAELAASGATFGWLDEALAAGKAPIDMLTRGEGFSEAYQHNLAGQRDRLEQYRKQNPAAALASEVVGGLAAGPAAGATVAAGLPGRVWQGIKYGAPVGAVTGAGIAEDDKAGGAVQGGMIGAGIGASIPIVGSAIRSVTSPVTKNISAQINPEGRAVDQLRRDLSRDGVTPAQGIAELESAQAAGKPMTIGDLGGRNVMGLGRAVATGKSAGSEQYNAFLKARELDAPGRIVDDIKAAMSDPDAFYPTLERIVARRKEVAAPLYEAAYAKPAPDNQIIRSVLSTPAGQKAVANAKTLSENEGIEFAADVRGLDLVKRSFDDMINAAKSGRQDNEARILSGMRERMVSAVDRAVPEYRAAREAFSSEFDLQKALERGRSLLKTGQDAEAVIKELRTMSAAEKEVARLGMARQLREMFDDTRMTASKLNQLVSSNRMSSVIKEVFPSQEAANRFLSDMRREFMLLKRGQQIQGGSNTANKLAEADDMGAVNAVVDIAKNPISGSINAALQYGQRLAKGVNEKTSNRLGEILSSTDPVRQKQILEQIEHMLPPGAMERLLVIVGPRSANQSK